MSGEGSGGSGGSGEWGVAQKCWKWPRLGVSSPKPGLGPEEGVGDGGGLGGEGGGGSGGGEGGGEEWGRRSGGVAASADMLGVKKCPGGGVGEREPESGEGWEGVGEWGSILLFGTERVQLASCFLGSERVQLETLKPEP